MKNPVILVDNSEDILMKDRKLQVHNDEETSTNNTDDKTEKPGKDKCSFPTFSKTVLDMFITDETDINQMSEDRCETEDFTVTSVHNINKPTAIVKPCQKFEVENLLNKNKDDIDKIFSSEKENKALDAEEIQSYEYRKQVKEPEVIDKSEEDILKLESKLKGVNEEKQLISEKVESVVENNKQMMMIVEEFEKTINQLVEEKEREEVCQQITIERFFNEEMK